MVHNGRQVPLVRAWVGKWLTPPGLYRSCAVLPRTIRRVPGELARWDFGSGGSFDAAPAIVSSALIPANEVANISIPSRRSVQLPGADPHLRSRPQRAVQALSDSICPANAARETCTAPSWSALGPPKWVSGDARALAIRANRTGWSAFVLVLSRPPVLPTHTRPASRCV